MVLANASKHASVSQIEFLFSRNVLNVFLELLNSEEKTFILLGLEGIQNFILTEGTKDQVQIKFRSLKFLLENGLQDTLDRLKTSEDQEIAELGKSLLICFE